MVCGRKQRALVCGSRQRANGGLGGRAEGGGMKLEDFRREYMRGGLRRGGLAADPLAQFERWLNQAIAGGISDPTAMVLATLDGGDTNDASDAGAVGEADGRPWQRIVLLKAFGPDGFVFYSNAESRKARAMADNPTVSLLFPWNALERQVIIGGRAEMLPTAAAARYFQTRPRESQLAAWASKQSRPLAGRDELERAFAAMAERFSGGDSGGDIGGKHGGDSSSGSGDDTGGSSGGGSRGGVPAPPHWCGYRVIPHEFEFWQGCPNRLHDRFRYRREGDSGWTIERLAP